MQHITAPAWYPDISLYENEHARGGGKETTDELRLPSVPFPWSLVVQHQVAHLYLVKNVAPEDRGDYNCPLIFPCYSHNQKGVAQ